MPDPIHPAELTARDRWAWEAGWRAGVEGACAIVRTRPRWPYSKDDLVRDLRALSPPATTTKEET